MYIVFLRMVSPRPNCQETSHPRNSILQTNSWLLQYSVSSYGRQRRTQQYLPVSCEVTAHCQYLLNDIVSMASSGNFPLSRKILLFSLFPCANLVAGRVLGVACEDTLLWARLDILFCFSSLDWVYNAHTHTHTHTHWAAVASLL